MAKKKKQKVGICHNPACPMCDIEQFFDEGQELKCSCCPEPLEEIVTGDNGDGTESTKKPTPWKRIGVVGIALALLVAIVWFIFFREPKPNHLEITLSKESITLNIGDSEALSEIITILSEDDDFSVSYVSDNISVARVDNQGTVHAISKGEANVTVIAQTETGIADTVQVKVTIKDSPLPKKFVSLSLNKEKIDLYVGESDTLKATVDYQPGDANISVFYTSDNENIVHVGNNGGVLAISKGEANITVIARMESGVADTVQAKVAINERPKGEKKGKSVGKNGKYNGTYDLGWGTYSGTMEGEKPADGIFGEITVSQEYTIDLKDGRGGKLIVKRGDVIVNPKFKDGKWMLQGELHRTDGTRRVL